ncbi:MAG TPA: hypothetical protein VF989_01350 [Polyangiaceae bacterium]
MSRVAAVLVSVAVFGAPLQCQSEPEASERRYDLPEEALYALAARFRAAGDEGAWRTALAFLIERYPNSRFAVRARDDLAAGGAAPLERDPVDSGAASETRR